MLANYPNRDGRLGNGVGLDTPAGTVEVLRALARRRLRASTTCPADGDALMARLLGRPDQCAGRPADARRRRVLCRSPTTATFFDGAAARPSGTRSTARWGAPEARSLRRRAAPSRWPLHRFGNVVVGVQPARGYNIDPQATYHDPELVPPHGYLAFYAWLRRGLRRRTPIVHMGKHGNLEWLPGKALALSADCFPEAALGPLPHLYPFIVNDPGEGTQAKRRAAAVIVDHLTPPLTRAESYGPLTRARGAGRRVLRGRRPRPAPLRASARPRSSTSPAATGLDRDCGIAGGRRCRRRAGASSTTISAS